MAKHAFAPLSREQVIQIYRTKLQQPDIGNGALSRLVGCSDYAVRGWLGAVGAVVFSDKRRIPRAYPDLVEEYQPMFDWLKEQDVSGLPPSNWKKVPLRQEEEDSQEPKPPGELEFKRIEDIAQLREVDSSEIKWPPNRTVALRSAEELETLPARLPHKPALDSMGKRRGPRWENPGFEDLASLIERRPDDWRSIVAKEAKFSNNGHTTVSDQVRELKSLVSELKATLTDLCNDCDDISRALELFLALDRSICGLSLAVGTLKEVTRRRDELQSRLLRQASVVFGEP